MPTESEHTSKVVSEGNRVVVNTFTTYSQSDSYIDLETAINEVNRDWTKRSIQIMLASAVVIPLGVFLGIKTAASGIFSDRKLETLAGMALIPLAILSGAYLIKDAAGNDNALQSREDELNKEFQLRNKKSL